MHQYLDSDGSGTSPTCVSSTIGAERLQAATQWLKDNNLKGFLGELGAGSNSACISAVQGALCSMQQSGVWIGALWWAAGPWWGDVRVFFSTSHAEPSIDVNPFDSTSNPSSPQVVLPSLRSSLRPSSPSCKILLSPTLCTRCFQNTHAFSHS